MLTSFVVMCLLRGVVDRVPGEGGSKCAAPQLPHREVRKGVE